ncbi:hypothetical protein CNE_BB1p06620 (plasmid) [Cupriavidus necator N-1]|uniref:Uncharacterized protein n=1 Tax=Cupriavidus necator (strain ATCC 43291 / DSM 13513 / CCUG 52238 / LMG 8453 / N-1) TaxID=1042878 RepID=F8GXL2_CUPNN|nr:hypothetical protein [Cupriavidus necator]AEI82082.1 hypothetical protein CNE_BB1p06620 [Cupriavidus necator N-1]MDX6008394.1 hypothetical protein [Cupriavidus necator]
MTKTDVRRSFVPFHSSYLFELATKAQKDSGGIPCSIMSVAAIEALPGDIAVSLHARQEFEKTARNESNQNQDRWGRKKWEFTVSNLEPLTPMERGFADRIKELTDQKRSGLDQYYVLDGLLREETRNPTDPKDKKAAWRSTLPEGVGELFELRNAIVHRGGSEFLYDHDGALVNASRALPPVLTALKDVLNIDTSNSQCSGWLELIDTPALARWSLSVTKYFINRTLETLPDTAGFTYLKHNAHL